MPFVNYAMNDYGISNIDNPNSWGGADNILQSLPKFYGKHKNGVFNDGTSVVNVQKGISYVNRNPLIGFVQTSVDFLAEDALKKLGEWDAIVQEIQDANYVSEMRPFPDTKNLSPDAIRAFDHISNMERMYLPYFKTEIKRSSGIEYTKSINQFADCTNGGQEASSSDDFCKSFLSYREVLNKKNSLSEHESAFALSYASLVDYSKEVGMRTLMSRYAAGEIKIPQVFESLNKLWAKFGDLKKDMATLSFKQSGHKRQVDADVEKSFNYMTDNFEKAFAAIRDQVFDELRKEAIQVKIARMRHAVFLAEKHSTSLPADFPGGSAAGFLQLMNSKFNCLSQYAVGPRYDEIMPGTNRIPLPSHK